MSRVVQVGIDYYGHDHQCRLVATVHINGGPDIGIWHAYDDSGFYLTEGDRAVTHHTTIRKAFSQACKNGGWG